MGDTTRELEHIYHLTRSLIEDSPCDHLHLVTVSREGEVRMLEATDDVPFRTRLYELLCADFKALGLLGLVETDGPDPGQELSLPLASGDRACCSV